MPPKGRAAAQAAPRASDVDITVAAMLSSASTPVASTSGGGRAGSDQLEGTPPDADKPSVGGPERPKKKSQRPSWSCTECTRRKIRCNRVVPGCDQCIRRNKVHLCRLEQDDVAGFVPAGGTAPLSALTTASGPPRLATQGEYEAISRSIDVVRQRLFHLERVMRSFVPQPDALDEDGNPMWGVDLNRLRQSDAAALPVPPPVASGSSVSHTPTSGVHSIQSQQPRQNEVEAAVTLEFLALGRDTKETHFSRAEIVRPTEERSSAGDSIGETAETIMADAPSPSRQQQQVAPLPDDESSRAFLEHSLEHVLWQHGCVHSTTFRQQCEEFYAWGDERFVKVNQAWLALYYAMLTVSVKHMSSTEAEQYGLSLSGQRSLAKRYFDAAVDALHRSHFLLKHSIYAVQAINIFAVSCQDIGPSDLIATLLASGLRIAQHLNLHRFGSDAEWDAKRQQNGIDPTSPQGVKGLIERELRKRVWYGLVTEDWISSHGRRAYSVSPAHFTTPLPLNCTDEDLSSGHLIDRPPDEPTVASKTILLFKVSDCLRRFFENVRDEASYVHCLEADRALRSIILDGPMYLKADMSGLEGSPPWTSMFRSYWVISISHKLLVVHRMFSAPNTGNEPHAYSRRVVIEAARSIIQQLARSAKPVTQTYWTIPWHTMSAATTIMLDIFQSPTDPDVPNKRAEVEQALEILQQLAPGSHIAARGVRLLSTLLGEEAKHRAALAMSPRPSTASSPAHEENGFGHVAKRARTSVAGRGDAAKAPGPSPSLTAERAPFFQPTLKTPSASSSPTLALPPLLPPPPPNATNGPAAPLSQEALEALFQGLGGGLTQSVPHEPPLAFSFGTNGDAAYDMQQEEPLDLWTLLGAGPGAGDDFGLSFDEQGMTDHGIQGELERGEWPVWSAA
ncbi:hypothetical protein JCM10908_002178 [Rhodotorula pacifica]|uniref:uncharacterized protein n=1 Tax=Rhodotorula pacifica TaxID=1495444 RepID=UPI003177245E